MSGLAEELVRLVFEEAHRRLAELEQRALGAPPARKGKRKPSPSNEHDPIVQQLAAEHGGIVVPASKDKGRRVLVSIDGRPPRVALVVDEEPKPGMKTIRLADGRSGKRFSKKTHRVLDSEVRGELTAAELANGYRDTRPFSLKTTAERAEATS